MRRRPSLRDALLQNAISGELNSKMTEWRALKQEIALIAERYEELTENEYFLESESSRLEMDRLEKEFQKKQLEFYNRGDILRVIFVIPTYLN